MRLLRLFSWSSLLILMTFAVQFNNPVRANRDLLNSNKSDYIKSQETIVNGAEGIEFTTLTPDKPVEIPKEGEKVTIELGLRITNNSLTEREFLLAPGTPHISSTTNQQPKINAYYGNLGLVEIDRKKLGKLLKPGESIEVFETANLLRSNGEIFISHTTSLGMGCTFIGFTTGVYSITMNYGSFHGDGSIDGKLWTKDVRASSGRLVLVSSKI